MAKTIGSGDASPRAKKKLSQKKLEKAQPTSRTLSSMSTAEKWAFLESILPDVLELLAKKGQS